jgi:hypothetical protein
MNFLPVKEIIHHLPKGEVEVCKIIEIHTVLKNPGFHCYMNSYIQVLYHIPAFYKLILSLDLQKFPPNSPVYHLKNLFIEMDKKIPIVSSIEIINSFNWTHQEKTSQHNVHEFSKFFSN